MRLAICVASAYEQNSNLPKLPAAELDLEVVSQRLAQPDAGFSVHAFNALRGLAEGIEQLIDSIGEPIETLLFYFSGYALLSDERGPALLLDGERIGTFSLRRLSKIVLQAAPEAAILLELVSPPDSYQASSDVVLAMNQALTGVGSPASVITAVRPAAAASEAALSPFSNLLRMVLDWRDPAGALSLGALWAGVQSDPALLEEIPAIDYVRGPNDPLLVPAQAPAARPSEQPSAPPGVSLYPFATPDLRSYIAEADQLAARGEHQAALEHYEGARAQLSAELGPDHVRLYEKIGAVLRRIERFEDARAYFEAALAIDPDSARSLDAVTDLSLELGDIARARAWLERWAAVDPKALVAHERLLGLQLAAGEHLLALETRRRLAHAVPDKLRAADQLYAAALAAEEVLNDPARAIDLLEEALTFDPSSTEVLQRVETLLENRREFGRLARVYEFSLERAETRELAQALARRLGDLCRDQLRDPGRAVRALARAAELEPSNHALFAELSQLFLKSGDAARAAELARRAIAAEATPDYLRLALHAFEKSGDHDAAWNAANALDWLGEADINEALLANQHRPDGLLLARANLTESDWAQGKLTGEADPTLVELLWALREGIVEIGLAAAKKQRAWPVLEPSAEQDLTKSTTTLAKTLLWASRLLAVPTPKLYVLPEVPGDLAGVPEKFPISVASRSVGSGLGLAELAFLWGRHLVQFRREHELGLFLPDSADQDALLAAALAVGGSTEHELRTLDGTAKRFAAGLKKHLRGANVEYVKDIVRRQPKIELRTRMRAYRRRAERAASRAGLLACGDIAIAVRLSERFPHGHELTANERRSDLVSFSLASDYGELRARLGVAFSG